MTVRLATGADAAGVRAIYAPYVRGTWVSFEAEVPSVAEMAGRIGGAAPRYPWLMADGGGAVAGYAYASAHQGRSAFQWSAEVSVYVAEAYRRRSLARTLYGALAMASGCRASPMPTPASRCRTPPASRLTRR